MLLHSRPGSAAIGADDESDSRRHCQRGAAILVWDSRVVDIYHNSPSNDARFVLGSSGSYPLVCFGVNPSTATPKEPDPTLRIVSNLVRLPFDSFLMFNLYPQRSTKPRGMHRTVDPHLMRENERFIAQYVEGRSLKIYAAWGASIAIRPYLPAALSAIASLPELQQCEWMSRRTTNSGHPHHPLGVSKGEQFAKVDIAAYISRFPGAPNTVP